MKIYPKNKFSFLNGPFYVASDPEEGDLYFNMEWRKTKAFPFFGKCCIVYKLINNFWVEQITEKEMRKQKLKKLNKNKFYK